VDVATGVEVGVLASDPAADADLVSQSLAPPHGRHDGDDRQGGRAEPYRAASSIAASPDGDAAIVAYGQRVALVWDLVSGRVLRRITGGMPDAPGLTNDGQRSGGCIFHAAWSDNGLYWLTSEVSDHAIVRIWRISDGCEERSFFLRSGLSTSVWERPGPYYAQSLGGVGPIIFTPDSRFVLVADDSLLRLVEIETGREVRTFGAPPDGPDIMPRQGELPFWTSASFSRDGSRLIAVSSRSPTICVWEVASGRTVWYDSPGFCCSDGADVSPDGETLVWAGCNEGRILPLSTS
jgi:WD40 repeat protein